jgi:hypothetical protein
MFLKHPMSGGEIPKGFQLLVQLCYKLWEGMNEEEELLAQAAMFSTLAKIDIGCF